MLTKGISVPKNGTRKAMATVDATRAVLNIRERIVLFKNPSGHNSSKLQATGFNNKANLIVVKDEVVLYGVGTVNINIILEALKLQSLTIEIPKDT